jgi:hypothetical protein
MAEEPEVVVTITSTTPGRAAAPVVTVMLVGELTVMEAAGTPPNDTPTRPLKLVPVMVTDVPPAVLPEVTLSPLTDGALTKVNRSALEVLDVPYAVVTVIS